MCGYYVKYGIILFRHASIWRSAFSLCFRWMRSRFVRIATWTLVRNSRKTGSVSRVYVSISYHRIILWDVCMYQYHRIILWDVCMYQYHIIESFYEPCVCINIIESFYELCVCINIIESFYEPCVCINIIESFYELCVCIDIIESFYEPCVCISYRSIMNTIHKIHRFKLIQNFVFVHWVLVHVDYALLYNLSAVHLHWKNQLNYNFCFRSACCKYNNMRIIFTVKQYNLSSRDPLMRG